MIILQTSTLVLIVKFQNPKNLLTVICKKTNFDMKNEPLTITELNDAIFPLKTTKERSIRI